jgi:hypothetical protein
MTPKADANLTGHNYISEQQLVGRCQDALEDLDEPCQICGEDGCTGACNNYDDDVAF